MRVKIGEIVDLTKDVNLKELAPLQRMKVALSASFKRSSIVQRYLERGRRKAYLAKKYDEDLVSRCLSYVAYKNLVEGKNEYTLQTGEPLKSIEVAIVRKYEYIIPDLIASKDFKSYNIVRIEENPDMLKAKPDMPIKLSISKKVLE